MEIAMSFTKPSPTPDISSSGIERVHGAFAKARAEGRCALLPFITAGFPDLATTERLLRELPAAGADIIELGIPFSDPIADGPVIAESMHRALLAGVTPDAVFSAVARVAPTIPVLAMVSISIVEKMGAAEFIRRGVECGLAGFIVADADPATAVTLSELARNQGAGFCALVSPSTSAARLRELIGISTGFVYLLARAGVTGERDDAPEIAARVQQIRAMTNAPIAAGFGIATAAHVAAVGAHADGAIVGSAIVRRMTIAHDQAHLQNGESAADAALSLVRSLQA
jgi:tryptophan synthase alpha chain